MQQNEQLEMVEIPFGDVAESKTDKCKLLDGCDDNHVIAYLHGEMVQDIDQYLDLINTLNRADEGLTIDLHINSSGGSLDTMTSILAAMARTKATVNTFADGTCGSAASFIFLAGNGNLSALPFASFCLHSASSSVGGRILDMEESIHGIKMQYAQIIEHYYSRILTEQEKQAIYHKQELYLTGEEVMQRLKHGADKYLKLRQEEMQKIQKARQEEAEKQYEAQRKMQAMQQEIMKQMQAAQEAQEKAEQGGKGNE